MCVDVTNIFGERNFWHEANDVRKRTHFDHEEELDNDLIYGFYISHKMVLTRRTDVTRLESRFENDTAFYDLPTVLSEEDKIKDNGNLILTPDVFLLMVYKKYHLSSIEEQKEEAYSPFYILKDFLSEYTDSKRLSLVNNDLLIDGNKKFLGSEVSISNKGFFTSIVVTLDYNKYSDFFMEYLEEDPNHIKSNRLITGVRDEIPNFNLSNEEFMNEYIKRINAGVFK